MRQTVINIVIGLVYTLILYVSMQHVEPGQSNMNENAFVDTIVTLLSIIVTIVIGYQIYNAVELNKTIKDLKYSYNKALEDFNKLEESQRKDKHELLECLGIHNAIIIYNQAEHSASSARAFFVMNKTLEESLYFDSDNVEIMLQYMRMFIVEMGYQSFAINFRVKEGIRIIDGGENDGRTLTDVIDEYFESIKATNRQIESHPNYMKIKLEHMRIINLLEFRLNMMKDNFQSELSKEEISQILGTVCNKANQNKS